MRSDYVEQGSISLASSDFLMQGNSRLAGSNKIEVNAKNKAVIKDDSSLVVGWEDAPVVPDERYKIYWDSKSGEVVDQLSKLHPSKLRRSRHWWRRILRVFMGLLRACL